MASPRGGEKGAASPNCWGLFSLPGARMAFDYIQRPPSAVSGLDLIYVHMCCHPGPMSDDSFSLSLFPPFPLTSHLQSPLSWPTPIIRFDRHQRNLLCEGHARLGGENLPCPPAQPGSGVDRDWQQHVFQHCVSRLSPHRRPLLRYHDSERPHQATSTLVTRESTKGDHQSTASRTPPPRTPTSTTAIYLIRGSNIVTGLLFSGAISKVASTQSTPKKIANLTTRLDRHHTFPPSPNTVPWHLMLLRAASSPNLPAATSRQRRR
jgi:hypothetical protein